MTDLLALIEKHSIRQGECLLWQGIRGKVQEGKHGRIRVEGKTVLVHRLAYILRHGPIADTALVCHTCDVPRCIEDSHHYLGDKRSNTLDFLARKTDRVHPDRNGENNPSVKLTAADIPVIRDSFAHGIKGTELAMIYGVSPSAISLIVRNKKWKEVA